MGFSKNRKALGTVVTVLFPYVTVTGRRSEGTLSVLYSPVLQVILTPKCSLPRQGHSSTLAGWLAGRSRGSHEVSVQWKPTWQQPDSLLNLGFAVSPARYFSVTSA